MNYIYHTYSNKGRNYKKKRQVSIPFARVFYAMLIFGNKKKEPALHRLLSINVVMGDYFFTIFLVWPSALMRYMPEGRPPRSRVTLTSPSAWMHCTILP